MDECIEWSGYRVKKGYGQIHTSRNGEKRKIYAHRWTWAIAHGVDPWDLTPDMVVRHICDNPPCVNPSHLLMGTTMDNILDKMNKGKAAGRYTGVTQCTNGHEFTPENTYYRTRKSGGRRCRQCAKNQKRLAKLLRGL